MASKRTPGQTWIDQGWGWKIASADQLLRTIGRISTIGANRIYAWRGQSSERFRLASSLYRYMEGVSNDPVDESAMREMEKRIVREARKYGIGRELGLANTDAHLLTSLQHHDIPTRLLDVTSNPFTALWFAVAARPAEAGVLFSFDVTEMPHMSTLGEGVTWASLGQPLAADYFQRLVRSHQDSVSFRVFPSIPDDRMRAQEGFFLGSVVPKVQRVPEVMDLTVGASKAPGKEAIGKLVNSAARGPGRPPALPFLALVIPPKVKSELLGILEGTYNRRRRVLFPDLGGFHRAFTLGETDLESEADQYAGEEYL